MNPFEEHDLDIDGLDFTTVSKLLQSGDLSCLELTDHYLDRINNFASLNTFISVFPDKARKRATEMDQRLKNGKAGPFAGMVLGIKDIIVMRGERVTCGTAILKDFVSLYDATAIKKLETADAIIVGKTNMDEFGMGSSNEHSYFGPVKNPHNPERVSGGSSGGSAAAVAGGLCMAALGSDTGGSIRQPASFCGVIGLKPTYGRVSRFGLVAFASSLDQIGTLTKSVSDAAMLLEIICGHDERDSTSANIPVPKFTESLNKSGAKIRLGIPKEYFGIGLDETVRSVVMKAVNTLSSEGAEVVEISLPHTEYAIAAYYILANAEASSNLARYDGARYGFRSDDIKNLEEMYTISRNKGFGDEVKRRIMLGTFVLSTGYYDEYYRKAQKVRTLIKRDFEKVFKSVDCVITPTSPTTAFKMGEKRHNPLTMYLSDIYTVSVNLAGLPAISVPCGVDSHGLPIGLQIIGKHFDEETILRLAYHFENLKQYDVKAQVNG
jgi:aspartyl-tRNA(Asn)/glutamyl-tRNA(Gln) amidotransferase subunit A